MLKPLNKDAEIMKHRRNSPSWQQPGCTYFVTWRLADSIPAAKLKVWMEAKKAFHDTHPEPNWSDDIWTLYHREITNTMEDYLDVGYGYCFLRDGKIRQIVCDALHFFEGTRWLLGNFVVMPNHVHVLLTPSEGHLLSEILSTIKRHTAREINRLLGRTGTPLWQ